MFHDLQLTVVMVIVEPGPASTLWLQLQTVSLEVIYSCQKCSFQMLENASPDQPTVSRHPGQSQS